MVGSGQKSLLPLDAMQPELVRLDTVLSAARQRQVERLRGLFARIWATQGIPKLPAGLARWLVLVGASVLSAVLVARHGLHIETTILAIASASMLSSIAGFAFSAICGAMLFHLSHDPVQVVQIMITCSIANQAAMSWAMRRDIDWRALSVYLAGGASGLMIGVWLLLHAKPAQYTQILGVFLLLYGLYMLLRRPMVIRRQHTAFDVVAGFLGGITGGAIGFPGATVTIWCGMKGWDKARQRALFQPFILIMQVAALLGIGLVRSRSGSAGFDIANLLFIPASLLGTALGLALYQRMSDRQFARAVNILLIVSGLSYVI